MQIFHALNLTTWQWVWVAITAFLVGFSKTGIGGLTMLIIPVIALVFGPKESTGILLPMLLVGDVFAVSYYNRHAQWSNIRKLLPWALMGIIAGAVVGSYINDKQFKVVIAVSVLICLVILIYMEKKGENLKVPKGAWFYALTGIASGFTSMIGNAAGPIFSVYLLAMSFRKNNYMGTTSWFFLIINATKMPFQIFMWHNITMKATLLGGIMIPVITIGALSGAIIIKRLNEKPFRYVVIAMTALTAIRLFM